MPEPKTIKMSVKDRLSISGVLPTEGDIITMTVTKDILDKVKISQAEGTEIELERLGGGFKWNDEKAKDSEIQFTKAETEVMVSHIQLLDKQKKITLELLPLCEKIKG
jgi:hypothetical protein